MSTPILDPGKIYHLNFTDSEALVYVVAYRCGRSSSPKIIKYETVKMAGTIASHNMIISRSSLLEIGAKNITLVPVEDLVLYIGLPYVSDVMTKIIKKIADRKPVKIFTTPGMFDGGYHLLVETVGTFSF
jgi:hypothetical protein